MDAIYILGIVFVICFFITALYLRERITSIKASGTAKHGDTELKGEAEIEAESFSIQSNQQEKNNQDLQDSINISGNTNIFGSSILEIFRSGVRVVKNTNFGGKTQISVSEKSSESTHRNEQKIYEQDNKTVEMQGILEPSNQEKLSDKLSNVENISELEQE